VDYMPLVGATQLPEIFVATGTWRNGILLAPFIASLISSELCDKRSTHRFSPLRTISAPILAPANLKTIAEDLLHFVMRGDGYLARQGYDLLPLVEAFLQQVFAIDKTAPNDGIAACRRIWDQAPLRESIPAMWKFIERSR
jgi:glycine oxidase